MWSWLGLMMGPTTYRLLIMMPRPAILLPSPWIVTVGASRDSVFRSCTSAASLINRTICIFCRPLQCSSLRCQLNKNIKDYAGSSEPSLNIKDYAGNIKDYAGSSEPSLIFLNKLRITILRITPSLILRITPNIKDYAGSSEPSLIFLNEAASPWAGFSRYVQSVVAWKRWRTFSGLVLSLKRAGFEAF